MNDAAAARPLGDRDYQRVLAFRNELRQFLRWSEDRAHAAGLTPALHQLLLVVRGHSDGDGATIVEVADALQMRHHSAVELAQRAEAAGLIRRERGSSDQRLVHLSLTARGQRQLEILTRQHVPRIKALTDTLANTLGATGSE